MKQSDRYNCLFYFDYYWSMNTKSLGDRVTELRNEYGWSQDVLAAKSGLTRVGISKIELGITQHARADTLFALAKALKCNAEWLLTGAGSRNQESYPLLLPGPQVHQMVPELPWSAEVLMNLSSEISLHTKTMHPCPVKCTPLTFALKIEDEMMEPRFAKGDLVFFDGSKRVPLANDFVIISGINQPILLFKQLISIDGEPMFKSLNPDYPSHLRYTAIDGFEILATAISHVKPI